MSCDYLAQNTAQRNPKVKRENPRDPSLARRECIIMFMFRNLFALIYVLSAATTAYSGDIKQTELYTRIKSSIDAVPAIDTHDHLRGFDEIPNRVLTPDGPGMTLYSI